MIKETKTRTGAIFSRNIVNELRNIVNESIDKVNNGTATSHDIWVVENISLNQFINHLKIFTSMERTEEIVANKQLRKDLDEKIQEVKNLPVSRERSICITKLQEAVMWLGMDLKRLNADNPYPSSKDPSTGDKIEPTADGLRF